MGQPHFKLSLIALALSGFSYGGIAHGISAEDVSVQKALEQPRADVERITVTANRKENLDTDLAMSVQAVDAGELALDSGQHVSDSLNSLSGVLINQLSGGQGHNAAIRMPINYGGYYLYLQDNIPLQSPAFFNHNALWWSSYNSDVSRMEVLKGAGTALYGSGAVAATVNILSKPIAAQSKTSVGFNGGENGYNKLSFSHSQAVAERHNVRVSGSAVQNDGWRDHTGSKRAEVTLRHEFNISDTEQLVNSLMVSDLELEMAATLLEDDYNTDRTLSGLSDAVLATDPTRKSRYVRLSSQWTKVLDDSLYLSMIPYYRHRTNQYTATWNDNMPKVDSSVDSFGFLAMASLDHSDGSETTVGLDAELSEGDGLSVQPIDFVTTGWGGDTFVAGERFYDDSTTYLGISPYAQHRRELSQDLDMTLGLRYDYANYEFDNHLGIVGEMAHGAQSLADREDKFSHLSPKASLNYHLTSDSSVYLRYANSFRIPTSGSLYHLKSSDSNSSIGDITPEISDTYELGYKVNYDSLTIDVALYSMIVDDAIVNAYNDSGIRYQANAGKVSHQGFEFAAKWTVNRSFDLSLAYTRAEHEFDEFILDAGRVDGEGNSKQQNLSGNEMRMAPEYIANLRLRFHPLQFSALSTMLEIQSTGDYWMDDANTRTTDGYTVANLKVAYQYNDQLSFNARIVNLTDKSYAQQGEIRYGKAKFAPGAPRTAYLSMNYSF
ncbi:MAG: iron complex outermembrane receptor protein [Phenylobacterium sp.]|jgi:iron complex outermembrane receptor protein